MQGASSIPLELIPKCQLKAVGRLGKMHFEVQKPHGEDDLADQCTSARDPADQTER